MRLVFCSDLPLPLPVPRLLPCGVTRGSLMAGSISPHDKSPTRLTGGQGLLRFPPQSLTGFRLLVLMGLRFQGATASPKASQGYALTARKPSPILASLIAATPPNRRSTATRREMS